MQVFGEGRKEWSEGVDDLKYMEWEEHFRKEMGGSGVGGGFIVETNGEDGWRRYI